MDRREVFLNAGDFYFHRAETPPEHAVVLRTLLGSCVSIVLWNPERKLGGMCHAVLPTRSQTYSELDGNHCPGAVQLFLRELQRTATRASQYHAYLLGGARMSLGQINQQRIAVGDRNVHTCRELLQAAGFTIRNEHVGLTGPRRVEFNLYTGSVDVLHANQKQTLSP